MTLIVVTYGTHKHPQVRTWLERYPRFTCTSPQRPVPGSIWWNVGFVRLLVRYGSHANLTIISGISSVVYSAIEAFEVKGEAVSTSFCAKGRCQTEICGDKVIYGVDTERSIVMRKAVLNKPKSLQGTTLDGLQADSTVYTIVYDGNFMVPRDDKLGKATAGSQRVIKAMGRDGLTDGFETVVIGEDSIHTSRSSADYFVIYYYKRVKTLPQP